MFTRKLLVVAGTLCLTLPMMASAQDKLVLYTSQPNTDAQQTVDAFQAAYPDIEVEWVRDGTTKLMTRLRAELTSGVSRADLLLIADSVTMESLKQEDLLQPYLSAERSQYEPSLYDAEGYYYGTKLITTGIVHHQNAAEHPASWADLALPAYKGQVAMPSPLYSGAALIHLAALTGEQELGWSYVEALHGNEAQAQGGNGGVLKAVAAGTKPYGVIVDFLAIREAAKGSPINFVFPKEGGSMVTEPVAIMKNAANPEAARKFVDFLLSTPGQELVRSQGYLPASNAVEPPAGFPARSEIKLLPFDASMALQNAEQSKERFKSLFGG